MATFLNYHRAARLSNDVGFQASCDEAFHMMGVQFSGLLLERTLNSQQDRHNFPFTAQPACACRAVPEGLDVHLNTQNDLKNAGSFL